MNACMEILEQMGDVAMEDNGEIVILQRYCMMISFGIPKTSKKYQVTE